MGYGYTTGVFSNRKLERASYDSVAFRCIAVAKAEIEALPAVRYAREQAEYEETLASCAAPPQEPTPPHGGVIDAPTVGAAPFSRIMPGLR